MGSKQRRKSKPGRRQATPAKPKTPANSQYVEGRDVGQPDGKEDRSVVQGPTEEPAQEQLRSATDAASDEVTATSEPDLKSEPEAKDQLSVQEATQVLELLVVAMLAASISPLVALHRTHRSLAEVEHSLVELLDGDDDAELRPQQRLALQSICLSSDGIVDTSTLIELARAAIFRLEVLEFQIRQAILDRASSKSRGKVGIQRAIAKLSSAFSPDSTTISTADFEMLLEEKLGVSSGSRILNRVVFARIMEQPFHHSLPKQFQTAKAGFCAALEAFVADKPLSLDSVEGQLRHLVSNHADLSASFKALDTDSSGAISVDEIVAFLQREAHMQYPRDVITSFIKRFDVDGDGTLSIEEFVAFVSPKQFGIHVLTPFGIFYHSADRHELMKSVFTKIKTRMFWMQHNDLFATSTQPVYKPPLKLKVSDHFVLAHHFGRLRLQYKDEDTIASVLTNGEMVVLVKEPGLTPQPMDEDGRLPEFEYRLKPNVKRSIPQLMSWTSIGEQSNALTVGLPDTTAAVKKPPMQSRKESRQSSVALRSEAACGDGASVVSTPSRVSPRSGKNAISDVKGQTRKIYPALGSSSNNRTAPSGTGRETPEPAIVTVVEPLVVVSETEAPSSASETSADYDYYDHEDDDPSLVDEETRFVAVDGDESGPHEELEDATGARDYDEEEPPPPYDG